MLFYLSGLTPTFSDTLTGFLTDLFGLLNMFTVGGSGNYSLVVLAGLLLITKKRRTRY